MHYQTTDGLVDGQINKNEWTNKLYGQMDGWMDTCRQIDRYMQIDKQIDRCIMDINMM